MHCPFLGFHQIVHVDEAFRSRHVEQRQLVLVSDYHIRKFLGSDQVDEFGEDLPVMSCGNSSDFDAEGIIVVEFLGQHVHERNLVVSADTIPNRRFCSGRINIFIRFRMDMTNHADQNNEQD